MSSPIIVFGSINMDLVVYSKFQPSKGETILGNSFETFQGGKGANQAVAVSRLGTSVSLTGKIGEDVFGEELMQGLQAEKIDTQMIEKHDGESGVALIHVFEDTSENQIIVISGANSFVKSSQISDANISSSDILISQLEIPPSEIEDLFKRSKKLDCYRVLNTAPALNINPSLIQETDLLVMNESELENLSRKKIRDDELGSILIALNELQLNKNQSAIITLGAKGVYVYKDQKSSFIEGHKVDAVDSTGSGDCFIGALASHYLKNEDLLEAAHFANKAGALSVTKKGASASMPTLEEVVNFEQIT